MVTTVESDGRLGPVEEEGGHELYREDLSMLALVLAHREARRGSPVDHKAVMDLGKPLILVVVLLFGVLLLLILLDAQAFEVSSKHVAILKVVIHGSLMVGTRFLEHLVEDAPIRGTSRLLAIGSGDKIVHRGFTLALLVLLLPVVSFGASVGALGVLVLALSLVLIATEDGTNCFVANGVVGDDVHQLISYGGGVAAQLSDQLLAGSSR
jgi:hypothetical protein